MKRDLIDLVPRPQNLLRRLKALAIGGALTSVGLVNASPATATPISSDQPVVTPTIVDRSRKVAKLVLRLPGQVGSYMVQHRSHASHASHASHYSGSGGTVAAPPVAAPRPPAPVAVPVPIIQSSADANVMSGVRFDSFDRANRVIKVKDAVGAITEFAWRDDTQVGSAPTSRMDDYLEGHFNNHPWSAGQQLTITWKPSADGKKRVATSIR